MSGRSKSTDVYVSPALDAVDSLAAFRRTAGERPVLLFVADHTSLPTDSEIHEAPAYLRKLASDCRPEPNLHLSNILNDVRELSQAHSVLSTAQGKFLSRFSAPVFRVDCRATCKVGLDKELEVQPPKPCQRHCCNCDEHHIDR